MKTHHAAVPAPIAILAARIIEDVSEWCARMAAINQHEDEPEPTPPARKKAPGIKGSQSGR